MSECQGLHFLHHITRERAITEICTHCEGVCVHPDNHHKDARDSCKGMAMMAHHATIKYFICCWAQEAKITSIYHVVLQEKWRQLYFWCCKANVLLGSVWQQKAIARREDEKICLSGGSICRIRSRFGVSVRSLSWNRSVRNGEVLGESSTYFREASRRLSIGREWDWHTPDMCWHVMTRNMPQEFGFHSLLWFIPHFPLTLD